MNYKSVKGTADILPAPAGSIELRQAMESISQDVFQRFGYREVRTPIIEERSLFVKSIGEETDIVTKEMFSFKDRGEREIVLRPEGTAPIVRAYLEANLHKTDAFQKFYYIGPMFRAERPQAGRMRQFHQIGAEAIGSGLPEIDAEIIRLLAALLDAMKIRGYKIRINNLGCKDDKAGLSKTLRTILDKEKNALCDDCKKRLDKNPLRVLDCKNESCRTMVRSVFKSVKFLCENCEGHFKKVLACLDDLNIKYELDPFIVRGLDYYTQTVFEVTHPELGSQDALGAGGRYDNLISDMGGPELGAAGFALGVERILIVAAKQEAAAYPDDKKVIYIATMGEAAKKKGFGLLDSLRGGKWEKKMSFDMDYENKSLKAQMREADKLGAKLVLIIGDDEIAKGEVMLRDMMTKEQQSVKFDDVARTIKGKI
ncbi:MAG: histidine--tRNA ligase [Candidatus Omnitrophica bacterium]|nr:histidine--tRNA ligase [Candidatus Omnitrophota bacterium]MDD5436357.1 histidine--tRNA ligase [Candidatus Omnitrophota bacterium]